MIRRFLHVDPYGDFWKHPLRRLAKTLSPRYLVARARLTIWENRHPNTPWLTQDAIAMLDRILDGTQVGFEWGSGNGTIWFARRSKHVISVEHHREWYEQIRSKLEAEGIRNHEYRFVNEEDYPNAIDDIPDESLDWVLVDGLFRDRTFEKSMPKVKRGGMIVFDNCNWHLPSRSSTPHSRTPADGPATSRWASLIPEIEKWTRVWTTNGVNDTAIFFKN